MSASVKEIRGYHPPVVFDALGALSLFTDAAVAGTFDRSASFGGSRIARTNLRIDEIELVQGADGTALTTEIEVFRLRSGVFTFLGSASLVFGGGDYSIAAVEPATEALRERQIGDVLVVHFVSRQTDGEDVTVSVSHK